MLPFHPRCSISGFPRRPWPSWGQRREGSEGEGGCPCPSQPCQGGQGSLLPCHSPSAPAPPLLLHHSGCSWLFQGVKGENGLPGPAGLQVSSLGSWGCLTPLLPSPGPLCHVPKLQPTFSCLRQSPRGLCAVPAPPVREGTKAAPPQGADTSFPASFPGNGGAEGCPGLPGSCRARGEWFECHPPSLEGCRSRGFPLGRGV